MSKHEFLKKLKDVLSVELSSREVEEHVKYYDDYIAQEVASGRTVESVLDELGDPWAIGRGILSMNPKESRQETVQEAPKERGSSRGIYMQLDTWWKKVLLVLALIGILSIVFAIVTGIVKVLLPIVIPVIGILLILKIFRLK